MDFLYLKKISSLIYEGEEVEAYWVTGRNIHHTIPGGCLLYGQVMWDDYNTPSDTPELYIEEDFASEAFRTFVREFGRASEMARKDQEEYGSHFDPYQCLETSAQWGLSPSGKKAVFFLSYTEKEAAEKALAAGFRTGKHSELFWNWPKLGRFQEEYEKLMAH